jgi:hypothetical protein
MTEQSPSESSSSCRTCGSAVRGRFCRECGSDMACTGCGTLAPGAFCKSCGQSTGHVKTEPAVPIAISSEAIVGAATGASLANSVVDGEQVEDPPTFELREDQSSVSQSAEAFEGDLPVEEVAGRNRKFLFGAVAAVCVLAIVGLFSLRVLSGSSDSASRSADSLVSSEIEAASTDTLPETATTTEVPAPAVTEPPAETEIQPSPQALNNPKCGPNNGLTFAQCQERVDAWDQYNAQVREGDRVYRQCLSDATQLQSNLSSLTMAAGAIDPLDPARVAADSAVATAQASVNVKNAECTRLQAEGIELLRNRPSY